MLPEIVRAKVEAVNAVDRGDRFRRRGRLRRFDLHDEERGRPQVVIRANQVYQPARSEGPLAAGSIARPRAASRLQDRRQVALPD